jgi:hypothetical protein
MVKLQMLLSWHTRKKRRNPSYCFNSPRARQYRAGKLLNESALGRVSTTDLLRDLISLVIIAFPGASRSSAAKRKIPRS